MRCLGQLRRGPQRETEDRKEDFICEYANKYLN